MLTEITFDESQNSLAHNDVGDSSNSTSGPFSAPITNSNSSSAAFGSHSSAHPEIRPTTTGIQSPTINITNNMASTATAAGSGVSVGGSGGGVGVVGSGRPATLPISSPFGPPSDTNSTTMVKSTTTTGDLNSTGLLATLATPKNTPLDSMKEWTDTFYKCTLQYVNEKLGKCQRTVDASLETEIERLRDTQRKYSNILETCRHMIKVYNTLVRQQQYICKSFGELAVRESKRAGTVGVGGGGVEEDFNRNASSFEPLTTTNGTNGSTNGPFNEGVGGTGCAGGGDGRGSPVMMNLAVDFRQNADMLRSISKSGEKLILALRFFCSNLDTVANKTIEDTILTIKAYESARLEYDAEKNAVANLLPAQAASAANTEKLISSKAKFERLRDDVSVKIQFLEENKAKVMHKQLVLLHNAFAAYSSGNDASLENTLKQFSIKTSGPQSWLEK